MSIYILTKNEKGKQKKANIFPLHSLQGEMFNTFSGGDGGIHIDPDPGDGEDDNHSNVGNVWDTL